MSLCAYLGKMQFDVLVRCDMIVDSEIRPSQLADDSRVFPWFMSIDSVQLGLLFGPFSSFYGTKCASKSHGIFA